MYRTLKLLAECGVANERRFGDGLTRYELADDASHHDHLICVDCGDITEFEEPRIEELQEGVARKYGFELRSHKHELYGVCAAARAAPRQRELTGELTGAAEAHRSARSVRGVGDDPVDGDVDRRSGTSATSWKSNATATVTAGGA